MKKIIVLCCFLFAVADLQAQSDKQPVRKIEVIGSAEMEITPDIIYMNITLKEYYDGKTKVTLDKLEKDFQKAASELNIPKENITINNIYGYNYYWDQKRDPNFEARKQFRIKLNDLSKVNSFLSKFDPKGVEQVNLDEFDHTKMKEYRKEVKVKALQAAKEKATYLLSGIAEKCGQVLEVQEIDVNSNPYPVMYMKTANAMMESDAAGGNMANFSFKTIKVEYQMRAVFEIVRQ